MKITSPSYRELESLEDERTRLYLVRHGELTTSSEWRYVGQMDVDMTENGVEQIKRVGLQLVDKNIDIILSSDLKRSARSAEIIGGLTGLDPVMDKNFREINIGRWEGLTKAVIMANFKEEFKKRELNLSGFRVENGESFVDLERRVVPALKACLEKYQGKNLLLVAHGGVNRVILCNALQLHLDNLVRIDQAYGCLNIIDYFEGISVVRLLNDVGLN